MCSQIVFRVCCCGEFLFYCRLAHIKNVRPANVSSSTGSHKVPREDADSIFLWTIYGLLLFSVYYVKVGA